MFHSLTFHGGEATIAWSYHTAAVCRRWTLRRAAQGRWTLEASLQRADPFRLRQQPLRFAIPRKGGYYCFPVLNVTLAEKSLTATLGPLEA